MWSVGWYQKKFFRKLLQCVFDKPHLLYFSIIYTVYQTFKTKFHRMILKDRITNICDGTESSVAGKDEPGFTRVCDETESSIAEDDEPDCDLTETEENNDTDVEETQHLDYLGNSLYGNTGATTIVKETQKLYPNNIDNGCHGESANTTLVETDRQVDKVEEDDDDFDVVIVAAESVDQNDIPSPRTKTRQHASQAHACAHSTSGLSPYGGNTSGGRTYRRGYRTSRLSRNRPSNNKNARLQNAASDSKQASVLDFFQPLWGKAKQAVETLTKAFSPPPDGSTTSAEQRSASLSRGVNDSDTGGATTSSTCDESSDVEGTTSTCSSVNSTLSDNALAGNKPWSLKSQQTSKAGITIIELTFPVFECILLWGGSRQLSQLKRLDFQVLTTVPGLVVNWIHAVCWPRGWQVLHWRVESEESLALRCLGTEMKGFTLALKPRWWCDSPG